MPTNVRAVTSTPARRVVSDPDADSDLQATLDGLTMQRDLWQMRRPLPMADHPATEVDTRPLRPGSRDETRWIEVNNQAFADHPDQSGMTLERLHADMAEDWFDPAGFLLHERDGALAAFCWTKQHPATSTEPAMGEIYVIGVAPAFQGLGLGRALTVAGLDHLADVGLGVAMLYVDVSNTAAMRLYDELGFERHHVDRVYEAPSR